MTAAWCAIGVAGAALIGVWLYGVIRAVRGNYLDDDQLRAIDRALDKEWRK